MKKILVLTLVVLVLVGIAYAMMTREPEREWTTDSEEARAELEAGLEALMKSYYRSSTERLEAAIEHDPDFAAAKALLLYSAWDRDVRDRLLEELRAVDLETLTDRERFLVDYALAKADRETERADLLIEEHLATHPEDPFVLMTCSAEAWEKRDWARAERHYQKLIESDPNWVNAQNRLGYIKMAQGKFDEAEEAFLKYHYIAPDQANPHDSMGELLTMLGRYDEARVAFEKALEIDPDFCIGYYHLADMFIMAGNFEPIDAVMAAAEERCDAEIVELFRCATEFWHLFGMRDYDAAFAEDRAECRAVVQERSPFVLHRLAVGSDRFDVALATEEMLRGHLEKFAEGALEPEIDGTRGLLLHMEGVRRAAQGDVEEGQAKMLQADDYLLYWGNGQGILKMYNLLNLAELLRQTGDDRAADAIFDKVHAINAHFVEMVVASDQLERELAAP